MTLVEISSYLILSWTTGFTVSLILGYFISQMRLMV
jgi:hypothetical protein